ncbi:hypothetical protein FPOAC2_05748 [Fusarium poae]|jgi:hypothetical protein|uniref:hypothetical protein n=1 Tax=Fusarium poae TaxID=36050 RepID=UPI001CE82046|nr:hypothetical protein FPOAC1_005631 [Fusarium poae]KAG8672364.1 hypothetical protein FPOAC1_005631 [Fusarium poae]
MPLPIFNEATTSFIVPLCLLTINLIEYLYSWDAKTAGFNCLLSIYLLASYFSGDTSLQHVTDNDTKSTQILDPGKQAKQTQKKYFAKIMLAILSCIGISVPLRTLSLIASDIYYGDGCSEIIYDKPLCTSFFGQSGPAGSITYRYQGWGYCDVSAERGIITNAVINHISERGSKLSSTECLDLGERDTNYLVIGPTDSFDFGKVCGPRPVLDSSP